MTAETQCHGGVWVTMKSGCVHCGTCGQHISGGILNYNHDYFTCTSIDAEQARQQE